MNYCTVCTFKYNEYDHIPLCMPCGHSYCHMCIERECVGLVLFTCPQCRQEISMTQVRTAPKNLALISVLQQQQNQTMCSQQGFWESIFSQANKTHQAISQLQTMEESGMMQKEILKCILCSQERYMFDGLQSVFCSYNCFTKWRTNS